MIMNCHELLLCVEEKKRGEDKDKQARTRRNLGRRVYEELYEVG